jgi:hypothetical protein
VKPAKYHTNQHYNNNLMGDKGKEKKNKQHRATMNKHQCATRITSHRLAINNNQPQSTSASARRTRTRKGRVETERNENHNGI